jgi:lipoprotein NlpD
MYLRAQSRWRLLLLCATLTPFTGCVSTHRPVASDEAATSSAVSMPSIASAPLEAEAPLPLAVEAGSYRVNAGDTLDSIAKSFGRAPASVARWNKMSVTDAVSVGQVLRVAPPASGASKPAVGAVSKPATAAKPSAASTAVETSRFKWPAPGPVNAKFATGRSKGVELGGRLGEPVKAAEGGRVVYAGARIKAYGRLIVIKHDSHFVTAYGNNRKLLVTEGAIVTHGQTIAEMGADTSGNASLKFEVRKDGKPVDPLAYLPKRPG